MQATRGQGTLCHTVAALQTIDDPCHAENNGLIQMSRRR